MKIRIIVGISIILILIIAVVVIATLPVGAKSLDISAKLSELVGIVEVRDNTQANFNPVNEGYILKAIQQLETQAQSKVRLDLSTGTIVRLGQSTIFSLDPPAAVNNGVLSRIQMQVGRLWIVLKGGTLDVNSPGGLASVRGSYMSVWYDPTTNTITVMCLEGHCAYSNNAGTVQLTSAQKIISNDINTQPAVQPMDMSDIQSWLDNCPESRDIIPQILLLVATSTPQLTPEYTPTLTTTLTATPTFTPTVTGTPTSTPSLLTTGTPPTATATATATTTPTYLPTATQLYYLPTATKSAPAPTATRPAPTPVPTQPRPTPVPTQPAPTQPAPTPTPKPYP